MSYSTKEFILGCLVGGILGAATAMLVPKKFLNGIMQASSKRNRNLSNEKAHTTSPSYKAKSTSHSNHPVHEVAKARGTKKAASRKVAKHA